MGFLGKQKSQNNLNDANGLSSLLGSMLGGQPQHNQNLITSLLDSDGDGSVLDDVADIVLGNTKKKGGLGGILGGLFGK
ncbi:MAG: putative ABC-type sugar transport system permease subunit [Sediminicola sp.]|jgi:predicted ABC-type sugar transport system permease subunit|tara:strand:- start:551 stop:787 length:237 start_codon:yes stop_codon:yes gene_type:complete